MGIFDNLFGKNKKVEDQNSSEKVLTSADVHLSDIISDWFNDSQINAGDFQTNFLDKCMQIYQSDPRLAVYFQNQPEQSKITYQTNLALLFLAAHAPNQVFMERVIRSIFDRNSAHYHISEFLKTPKFSEEFKNHPDLKRTLLLGSANFKNYHAAVLRLDANFSVLSSIISTLSSFKFDTEPYNFTHALQFVHGLDFKEKTFVLLYVFIHKHINHREKKAEETQVHESEILCVSELSLAKFNEDFNQSITMQDLTAFGEAVYGIKFSQKWIDTDYKNQKSLKADDIPTLSIYLNSVEDSRIAITLLVAGLAAIYISDNETKIYSTLLKKLMVKLSPDSIWAEKLFSLEIGSNNVFSEEHIFIPIFEKLIPSLSFDHPLRQIFERMILQQSGYGFRVPNKKAIALLDKLCETITDSNLKNFCHLHYSSVYGNASIHQERLQRFQINLHFEDKSYSTLKALVSELNKIIPCTLMNVAKQGTFYSENASLFTLHTDGADIEFTAYFLAEINQLLVTKKTGMRLIPIPLQIFQGRDGLRCVFAAAFLNKSQFHYLTEIYFEQHFPSIKEFNVGEFLSDVSFEGMDAPSLHERSLNAPISGNENSQNDFKNNPDWQWFKERYIDTLNSNLEWYELMTTLIEFPESKKLIKDWTSKIHEQIHAFGEERFSRELGVLINSSIKEDFWFFDKYAIGLKGIIRASAAL
ncbi:MAG: hypothetical protein IPO32_03700 [Crocinitomicaceae bacterium]|nr:hypothetical protein [Crocinitomicaceae bacterium]